MESAEKSPAPAINEDLISDGQFVLIQRGEQDKIIEFKAEGKLRFGRGAGQQEIELKNAAGLPYFSTFRVQRSDTEGSEKVEKKKFFLEPAEESVSDIFFIAEKSSAASSGKDNRNIVDDNKSQRLGQTDIAVLREKGVSGPEILDTLISSSKTFSQKTEFSQEKYVKKKVRAYGDALLFVKPTLKLIADYYFKKDPSKIMNLRADSIAQLLTYSNVSAGGKYMVYETGCSSLVIAGVLQRLGGHGLCLHVHTGSTPQRQALYYMNFTSEELKPLQTLDIFYVIRHGRNRPPDGEADLTSENSSEAAPPIKKAKISVESTEESIGSAVTEESKPEFKSLNSLMSVSRLENQTSTQTFQTTEFDGLIICAKEHPLTILQNLLPKLRGSGSFAVFSQYPEPLGECFTWLKDGNYGINLNIFENWFRNIQIQPERTHPEINMSSTGGFILTGIYITR